MKNPFLTAPYTLLLAALATSFVSVLPVHADDPTLDTCDGAMILFYYRDHPAETKVYQGTNNWNITQGYSTLSRVAGDRFILSNLGPMVNIPVDIRMGTDKELGFADLKDGEEGILGVDQNGDSLRIHLGGVRYTSLGRLPNGEDVGDTWRCLNLTQNYPTIPQGTQTWAQYFDFYMAPYYTNDYVQGYFNPFLIGVNTYSSSGRLVRHNVISNEKPAFVYLKDDEEHALKTAQHSYEAIMGSVVTPTGYQEYYDQITQQTVRIPIHITPVTFYILNFMGSGSGQKSLAAPSSSSATLYAGQRFDFNHNYRIPNAQQPTPVTYPVYNTYHGKYLTDFVLYDYQAFHYGDTVKVARKRIGTGSTRFEPLPGTKMESRWLHYRRFSQSLWDHAYSGDLRWRPCLRIDIKGPWEYNLYAPDTLTFSRTLAKGDSMKIYDWAYLEVYPKIMTNTVERYGYDPQDTERRVYIGGKLKLGADAYDYVRTELYLYPGQIQDVRYQPQDSVTGLVGAVDITDDVTTFCWPADELGELPDMGFAAQAMYARRKCFAAPDADGYVYYNQLVPAEKLASFEAGGDIPDNYTVFAKVYYEPESELTPTFHALGFAQQPTTSVPRVGVGTDQPEDITVVGDWDISGRPIDSSVPGIHIRRFSDGAVLKIWVR